VQTSRGTGWGECSIRIDQDDADQALEACWEELYQRLGPAVLALGEVDVEGVCDVLDQHGEMPCAKAGVEIALWHAAAMARGLPLHALLGGVVRPIGSGLCVAVPPTIDDLLDDIKRHLADGYRRVKLKINPNWDIEPVARVREQWPELPLMVDGGGSYSLDHLETLRNLDKYHLAAIEQPLPADALDASAQLQRALSTPICLSAPVADVNAAHQIAKRRAARILSVDIQRVGGLTPAVQIHNAARKGGLTCWLGTTPDLGIGAAAGLHLATLDGFAHPGDVGSSRRWFADDLLEPPIAADAGGFVHLPDGPGFGYRPNGEKVAKYTVRHETLTA